MRNLTPLRPPAKQHGRLQRHARRVLWLMHEATTAQVMEWSYCLKVHRGERIARWDYRSTSRALVSIGAKRVGRAKSRGRPWIWRLSDTS